MEEYDKKLYEQAKKSLNIGSMEELALLLGYAKTTVNNWYKSGFTEIVRMKIANAIKESSKKTIIEESNRAIEAKKLSVSKSHIDESSLVKVPIMSASASGSKITTGIEHFDVSVDGELLIDRMLFKILPNLQNIQAVRVIGESMYPTLREDDYVVIECEERFTGDGLYVLSWDGILLVKRLQAGNSVVRVLSDNQTFESMEYNPTEDQRTFHIVGKVILKIQR